MRIQLIAVGEGGRSEREGEGESKGLARHVVGEPFSEQADGSRKNRRRHGHGEERHEYQRHRMIQGRMTCPRRARYRQVVSPVYLVQCRQRPWAAIAAGEPRQRREANETFEDHINGQAQEWRAD